MFDIILAHKSTDKWQHDILHEWPHALTLEVEGENISKIIHAAQKLANTEMFWLLTSDWDMVMQHSVEFAWKPPQHDRNYIHSFIANTSSSAWRGFRGLYLIPRRYIWTDSELEDDNPMTIKSVDRFEITTRKFDIFYISYDEPFANTNFDKIKTRYPHVQRVHGITGIANAHRRCAELSKTAAFWTIDADAVIRDDFNFDYLPSTYDRRYLHIWYSQNPVNDTIYGWGAVKLWPRQEVLGFNGSWLDYTTSVGRLKIIEEVAAVSNFNADPLSAWRSGFREAVKLCSTIARGSDDDSLRRLCAWVSIANPVPFAELARDGARAGMEFWCNSPAIEHQKINDFSWLAKRFKTNGKRSDQFPSDRYANIDTLKISIMDAANV